MSIWNTAHNIGGGLVGPLAIAGLAIFGSWESKFYFPGLIALVVAVDCLHTYSRYTANLRIATYRKVQERLFKRLFRGT